MHHSWFSAAADYCQEHSSAEPSYLKELTAYTWNNVHNPRMLSGHLQGRMLSAISKLVAPNLVLELGTFIGYSALCLAEGLRPNGKVYTIEANAELAFKAEKFIQTTPFAQSISIISGEALDVLPTLDIMPDLVFIDADKRNYEKYYDLIIPKLGSGGVLLIDNVLWSGKVLDEKERQTDTDTQIIHQLNKKIASDKRIECVMLPLRDGLTWIRKN